MAAPLILIIYVIVYLATITRRKTPSASAAAGGAALATPQAEPGDLGPDWTSRLFALMWPQ
jgi:hypothetical protein